MGGRSYAEDQQIELIVNDLVWVVEDNGSIEGYGHLKIFKKNGLQCSRIVGLYLTRKVVGKSLGKAIIDLMLEEMRFAKVKHVSLESTTTARDFFCKVGFVDPGTDSMVEMSETNFRCHPMMLEL